MTERKTLIAIAVAALIPLGAAAVAGDYGSKDKAGAAVTFKQLDTNKDGRLSQTEAAADADLVFSTADTNGDGYIDSAEWKAAMSKQPADSSSRPQSLPSDQAPTSDQTVAPSGTNPTPDTETPRQ